MILVGHPDLPNRPKYLIIFMLSYLFSPIDLIPDFIPVIGHWDDFILIPIIFVFINRSTPEALMQSVRKQVKDNPDAPIFSGWGPRIAAISIVVIWLGISVFVFHHFDLLQYF